MRSKLFKHKIQKSIFFIELNIVLLILCVTIGCLSSYENHLKLAMVAISNDNYDEAIEELTKAVEINLKRATAYSWRGSCYYQKAQYVLAIDDFTTAINLKDKGIDHDYNSRGLSYSAIGDYRSAISDYTKAIEIYPNPLYYDNRGLAYNSQKNYDLAIKDFTVAINLAPRDARLYSNRADSYIATGQTSLAIADLRKTIELALDDPALTQSANDRLRGLGQ